MKHIWLGNGCLYAPGSKLLLGMVIPPFIKNPWVVDHPFHNQPIRFCQSHFRGPQRAHIFLRALASGTACYGNHQDIGWIIQATATSENLSFKEAFLFTLISGTLAFLNCSLVIVDHNISQLWHHSSKKPRQVANVSEVVGICMQVSKPQRFLRLFCASLDTPSLE